MVSEPRRKGVRWWWVGVGLAILVGLLWGVWRLRGRGEAPAEVAVGGSDTIPEIVSAAREGRRVLFVGLDGGDWQLLDRYVAQGAMPHLEALIREGRRGVLQSEHPPLSPLLWTTMMTGASPLEHRILDFTRFHPITGRQEPITSGDRQVPAIWNMASWGDRRVAVFGLWATYPAEPVRGVLVSDRLFSFFHHQAELPPGVVYPPELEGWAREGLARAEAVVDFEALRGFLPWLQRPDYERLAFSDQPYTHPVSALRRILVETEVYHALAAEYLEDHDVDLTVLYLQGTDTIGHTFAPYAPPRQATIAPQDYERYWRVPELYFRRIDALLGEYRRWAEERQAVLVLASDHGFEWGEGRPATVSSYDRETAAQWHRQAGIYLLWGAGIEPVAAMGEGGLRQVAATLLALLGLPAGRGVAGPALPGAESPAAAAVDYRRFYQPLPPSQQPGQLPGTDDELAKLRALGYLGDEPVQRPDTPHQNNQITRTAGSYNNEGVILKRLERPKEAESAFLLALALDPGRSATYSNLGALTGNQGRHQESIEHFRNALRTTPKRAESYLNLAAAFARAGRWDEAKEQYEQCVERLSGARTGNSARAGLSLCRQMLEAAESTVQGWGLSPAVGAGSDQVESELQGICAAIRRGSNPYFGQGQLEVLRNLERRVAGSDPLQRTQARQRLAGELLRQGDVREAIRIYGETLQAAGAQNLDVRLQLQLLTELGVAYLRLGEAQNCLRVGSSEPCPSLDPSTRRHRDPTAASEALRAFSGVLAGIPEHPTVRWLANLAALWIGEWPDGVPEPFRAATDRLSSDADLPRLRRADHRVRLEIVGTAGGVVMDDFDGDGWIDVVTSSLDPCAPIQFYRNDGRGEFEDRSEAAGLSIQLGGVNLSQADYDNDGDLDLFVARGGWFGEEGRMRNSLLRNRGDGTFTDVSLAAGLAWPAYPSHAGAWADYDGDGDLDLYVTNDGAGATAVSEASEASEASEPASAYPSQLFRNNGDGTFTDVAEATGTMNLRAAKGAVWGDLDGDMDPDLFVANFGADRLYRNDGGSFTDIGPRSGLARPDEQTVTAWWFDLDNDGDEDLFTAGLNAGLLEISRYLLGESAAVGQPQIYRNDGRGRLRKAGSELGLEAPALALGGGFADLDNDGWLDFGLGTGLPSFEALMPNLLYRNRSGVHFQEITFSSGFAEPQRGSSVAFGDLDNDGDPEIFVRMGGVVRGDTFPSILYENPSPARGWIGLFLRGVAANRDAIGARIELRVETADGPRRIHRHVGSGGSHGASSLRQLIGLGSADRVRRLQITWPGSGRIQVFENVAARALYEVREGDDTLHRIQLTPTRLGGSSP